MKTKQYPIICFFIFLSWLRGNSQRLEIHHIGVGRGDCTFIIAQDLNEDGEPVTRTMLIDAGEGSNGQTYVWPYVLRELERIDYPRIDFIISSHIHFDHLSGLNSFFTKLKRYNNWHRNAPISIGYIIDRTVEVGAFHPNSPKLLLAEDCYSEDEQTLILRSSEKLGVYFNQYKKTVLGETASDRSFNSRTQTVYTNFHLRTNLLGMMSHMAMYCLTGNGKVADWPNDLQIAQSGRCKENDLSYSFVLQFNSFQYFTGGDLGGAVHGGSGTNMETPLVNSLFFREVIQPQNHVCAFKVSHHGSAGSTNDDFIYSLNPSLAVIMANYRKYNGTPLPTLPNILDQLAKVGITPENGNVFLSSSNATQPTPTHFSVARSSSEIRFLQDVVLVITEANNPDDGSGQPIGFEISLSTKEKDSPEQIDTQVIQFVCDRPH